MTKENLAIIQQFNADILIRDYFKLKTEREKYIFDQMYSLNFKEDNHMFLSHIEFIFKLHVLLKGRYTRSDLEALHNEHLERMDNFYEGEE